MAEIIKMPRLSDTMTEGVVAEWKKGVGDKVEKGDILAKIQTDKANMELESFKSGYLLHRGGETNASILVDDLLAIIGEKDEDVTSLIAEISANDAPLSKEQEVSTSPTNADTTSDTTDSSSNTDVSISMDEVVIMPRLSDTMESGTIIKWYKKVGDTVEKGDLLAEIETDKATMDLESFKQGVMLHIAVEEGKSLVVNELLCIVGKPDTDVSGMLARFKSSSAHLADTHQVSALSSDESTLQSTDSTDMASKNQTNIVSTMGRIKISPLAKKMASEKHVDISQVQGSGDGGRIIKKDIEQFLSKSPTSQFSTLANKNQPSAVSFASTFHGFGQEVYEDIAVSQMRSAIAKRLVESKRQVPHFYLKAEVVMDTLINQRQLLNQVSPVKISFNDIIIKICATALTLHPEVNRSWINNMLRRYDYVHIGSAVAIEDGLIVPVVKHANLKGLVSIASEAKELYQKARDKKLHPNEFSGGTFTVSNLGMMDIDEFSAIINSPESCIMAVGKIREVVVKRSQSFDVEQRMSLTLSCDHRVVDGAVGAQFLQTIKRLVENPLNILL